MDTCTNMDRCTRPRRPDKWRRTPRSRRHRDRPNAPRSRWPSRPRRPAPTTRDWPACRIVRRWPCPTSRTARDPVHTERSCSACAPSPSSSDSRRPAAEKCKFYLRNVLTNGRNAAYMAGRPCQMARRPAPNSRLPRMPALQYCTACVIVQINNCPLFTS